MLSVDTPLTVNVVDVTDPPPAFTLNEYTFSVNEGEANVSIIICTSYSLSVHTPMYFVFFTGAYWECRSN